MMYSLGKKIEQIRKEHNITQEDLASALDVSRQAISQWEADLASPKTDKLKMLCEYFNVKPDYFLFENSEAEPLENQETAVAQDSAAAENQDVKPKKKSRKKTVITTISIVFLLVTAAILIFIAWLETPPPEANSWASSSSWHFDLVTFFQLLAAVLIIVCVCIIVVLIVKYVKDKRK